MSTQSHLSDLGVSMTEAYDFITSNLNNLNFILQICELANVTTDMIGEILVAGGINASGEDVANYFALNGLDPTPLGSTVPTIEVVVSYTDDGVVSTDQQGKPLLVNVDTDTDGVHDSKLLYEYRDDGSYVISEDNNLNGLYEEFVIYNADGLMLEQWFDHNENDYFGARMIFDAQCREIEFYLDADEDGTYDSVARWSYEADGSYTLNEDNNFNGIYEEFSIYDANGNKIEEHFDHNENGYYGAVMFFDTEGREIEFRLDDDEDGQFDSITTWTYGEDGSSQSNTAYYTDGILIM